MGTLRYGVVTRVPDPSKGDPGNMAVGIIYQSIPDGSNDGLGSIHLIPGNLLLSLRVPVFTRGEVLILDGDREPHGQQRNPGKWDVSVELFATLDEALARAQALA